MLLLTSPQVTNIVANNMLLLELGLFEYCLEGLLLALSGESPALALHGSYLSASVDLRLYSALVYLMITGKHLHTF